MSRPRTGVAGLRCLAGLTVCLLTATAQSQGSAEAKPRQQPRVIATEVLRGSVTAPEGQPVHGVTVELWRREAAGFNCLDLQYSKITRLIRRTRTARDGSFALHIPRGLSCELHLDVAPYAKVVMDDVFGGGELDIRLHPPATIRGKVTLAETGAPQPGSRIKVWDRTHRANRRTVTANATGEFEVERLTPGNYYVSVRPKNAQRPPWQRIEVEPGRTSDLTFVVNKGAKLVGTVRDAETKKPIAGVEIGEGWTFGKSVFTDASGAYQMLGFGAGGYQDVHARAAGYGKVQRRRVQRRRADKVAAVTTMNFELHRAAEVTGRVVYPDGKPAADVYVAVIGMREVGGRPNSQGFDWLPGRTDEKGRFRVDGMRHYLQHVVFLRRDGWATCVYDIPTAAKGAKTLTLDATPFTIQARRILGGRILDADDKPVGGARIELLGCNADRHVLKLGPRAGKLLLKDMYVAAREVKSSPSGYYRFGDLAPGTYLLRVRILDGRAVQQGGIEIEIEAGKDPKPLDIRID